MASQRLKILTVQFKSLGDTVVSIPTLTAIRRRFPDCELHALVPEPSVPLLQHHPALNRVWGVPRAPLSLAFSSDGGRTFGNPVELETGSGYCLTNNSKDGLNHELSYPSIIEAPNGDLEVAFTYFRRAIKHVRLKHSAGWPYA